MYRLCEDLQLPFFSLRDYICMHFLNIFIRYVCLEKQLLFNIKEEIILVIAHAYSLYMGGGGGELSIK